MTRLLAVLLAAFVLLATIYSIVTPIFEASDELWHYPMVQYVADHNFGLPVQDPATAQQTAWRQEGGQPPLYYLIGAAATFWIDTSDLDTVRRINPHADIGVVVPDGNANMVVHNTDREDFPWNGTVLAIHIVRFLSILMGAGTVYLTYLLADELFPEQPLIALGAAALVAFNPMFLFVSAVINNDNLSTLLATLILWMLVRLLKMRDQAPSIRFYVLLGIAAGAGMLSKFQIGFLLPLVALALVVIAVRLRDWRPVVIGGLISGGLTILIAGWWYWRNYDLYGDATGINIFLDIVGRRAVPADLRQLWTEREAFGMSYWGFFGGVNVPFPDWVYTIFNGSAGISVLGLIAGVGWRIKPLSPLRGEREIPLSTKWWADLMLPRLLAILWPIIVFVSLISWTRQTWASQGRLWFSAIAPISVWMAVGLTGWLPARNWRMIPVGAAALWFAGVAILAPFATIRPAYILDRDAVLEANRVEQDGLRVVCFAEPEQESDALCAAYHPLDGTVFPGDYANFTPIFTSKGTMANNWSIFVHFVNEDGLIEAQRDVYPGGGLLATSEIEPGETWNNPIAVKIPEGIYAPQTLDVYLGFYHLQANGDSSQRMIPSGTNAGGIHAGGTGADADHNRVYLGQVHLEPPPGDVPNPVDVNFGGELQLMGYEVSDRSLAPGDPTTITLYWQAEKSVSRDYVISIQIIDPATLSKAAQDDQPADPPTNGWTRGETITQARTLTIFPDAPPGRYRVMVRVYAPDDPAHPLRIRTEAGGQSEDFVLLNWIQVQ